MSLHKSSKYSNVNPAPIIHNINTRASSQQQQQQQQPNNNNNSSNNKVVRITTSSSLPSLAPVAPLIPKMPTAATAKAALDQQKQEDNLMIQELHDEILGQIKEEEDAMLNGNNDGKEEQVNNMLDNEKEDKDSIAATDSDSESEMEPSRKRRRVTMRKRALPSLRSIVTPPPLVISSRSGSSNSNGSGSSATPPPPARRSLRKRKHRPSEEFPSDDAYKPDNNSCNVINKNEMDPPPTEEELDRGYCHRTLTNGKIRLVCTTCGKHYTTMYNMRQHRNIHTGSGLHTCRYCGKDFTHKHIWEVRNKTA